MISQCDATAEQVGNAGIRLFVITYGGKPEESLNKLRYLKFMEMISSCKITFDPQKLPPTERAAYFHSLRVHLQVTIWDKFTNDYLDPKLWGWELEGSAFTPVMTDMNAAPDSLLKIILC